MNISKLNQPMTSKQLAVGLVIAVGISLPSAVTLSNSMLETQEVQTVVAEEGTVETSRSVQLAFAETGTNQNEAKAETKVTSTVDTVPDTTKEEIMKQKEAELIEKRKQEVTVSRGGAENRVEAPAHGPLIGNFRMTSYDLSVEACGKSRSHKLYGITASGYNLKGKDARDRKVAVDPGVIKMGSKVFIEFPEEIRYITLVDGTKFDLNGEWTAVDTGGGVNGKHIDLFFGEDAPGQKFYYELCKVFGLQHAKVYSIKE